MITYDRLPIRPQIVLDGHDGAGKTTLAQMLAQAIGGCYVKPFNNTLGDLIIWLYRNKRYEQVDNLAVWALEKVYKDHAHESLLIFDRHWLCIFTLLPNEYYERWLPLPPTVLCWTNLETTIKRLEARGETVGPIERHQHYCERYRDLATQYNVPLIDTTHCSSEEALEQILSLETVSQAIS
jgi:thymidylate kinase